MSNNFIEIWKGGGGSLNLGMLRGGGGGAQAVLEFPVEVGVKKPCLPSGVCVDFFLKATSLSVFFITVSCLPSLIKALPYLWQAPLTGKISNQPLNSVSCKTSITQTVSCFPIYPPY